MDEFLRIVVLSDTHGLHDRLEVPPGDVLIHTGDFTMAGGLEEVEAFNLFLGRISHRWRIVIAGNHDACCQNASGEARTRLDNAIYLEDEEVVIEGLKFYGSPWQPQFQNLAFNLPRGRLLRDKWAKIPDDTDVLITHTPPWGVLDSTLGGLIVGCEELAEALRRVRPRLHLFGHIHEAYGVVEKDGTTFANASNCTLLYDLANPPLVFELPLRGTL